MSEPVFPQTEIATISAAKFAVIFQGRLRQLAWFLGAGASAAGGIPTGYDMITEFKARVFCRDTGLAFREIDPADPLWLARIEDHAAFSPTLPAPGSPGEYSAYFEEIYPSPADRRNFIDEKLSKASPSYAHRVLAAAICSGQSSVVFTTNFDQLVETSCTAADELLDPADRARINVADLQRVDVAKRCDAQGDWPLLVKLHGDYQSENLKNISDELAVQDEHLRQVMVNLCGRFGVVVVGYSGRDESVMEALGAALTQPSPFPAGIFWVTRPESTLLPAVSEWLTAAVAAGVEVHLVEAENFDELMGVTERQLMFPEALSEHVRGARPAARVTPVAMPVPSGQKFPVLRTSALPVLELPIVARRVALREHATTRELREALRDADKGRHVGIAAIAGGAAAFGRDDDLLEGLSALGPEIDGEVSLDPGADSWAHGLLYDALVHALARGHPARPVPGRHLVVLQPPPQHWNDPAAEASRQELAGLRAAYKGPLHGDARQLGRYFAEAVRVSLECWMDRWWCVLDPMTWLADPRVVATEDEGPRTRRPNQAEKAAAASWIRERWAQRYNSMWHALIHQWSGFLAPTTETRLSSFGVGPGDGVDAVFALYNKSGFSRPGSRPGVDWRSR